MYGDDDAPFGHHCSNTRLVHIDGEGAESLVTEPFTVCRDDEAVGLSSSRDEQLTNWCSDSLFQAYG